MFEKWLIFVLLGGFANIGYSFISRKSLKDSDDALLYSCWFSILRTIPLIPILFIDYQFLPSFKNIFFLILLGLINTVNIFLFMRMHSRTELSISTIVLRLRTIWVPLLAFVFLGERLIANEYLGIVFLFMAAILIASPKRLIFDKSVNTVFIFSINTSIVTIILKQLAPNNSPTVTALAMSLIPALILPFVVNGNGKNIFHNWRSKLRSRLGIALFSLISLYSFIFALKFGEVSKVNALFQSMSMLTVIIGIVVLKERKLLAKKLIGTALAVIGVLLLT